MWPYTVGYRFPSEQRSQARSSSGSTSIREGEGRLSAACFARSFQRLLCGSLHIPAPRCVSFPNYFYFPNLILNDQNKLIRCSAVLTLP